MITKTPPATPPKFKPMKTAPHPRLADIDDAQPSVHVPRSTGNYNQYSTFMLNNGRSR